MQGEVQECDLVAVKGEEMILVELKTRVTVTLLIQAARRKDISDSVYICVPVPEGKKDIPNARGLRNLLRKLEVGLIIVRFMKTKTKVDMVLHPRPYEKRMRRKKQAVLLREVNGRYGEFHKGGISTKEERISAYRQEAIRSALILREEGQVSPALLRERGIRPDKAQSILAANHYGWFDRVNRGVYVLNGAGEQALSRYEKERPGMIKQLAESLIPKG